MHPLHGTSQSCTMRSASGNGGLRISTAFTKLNIAAVPPMPRASVRIATSVKPGDFLSCRAPEFQIGCQHVQRVARAFVADIFFHHFLASQFQPRSAPRLVASHSGAHVFFDEQVHVRVQLSFEVSVHSASPEQIHCETHCAV